MNIRLIMSAASLVGAALIAHALPAIPTPVIHTQPDGSLIEVRLHGDEYVNYATSVDGSRLLRLDETGRYVDDGAVEVSAVKHRLAAARRSSPLRVLDSSSAFPAHGRQKAVAVLVEFPETTQHPGGRRFTYDNPRQLFDDMLNLDGFSFDGASGSVHEYFYDNSAGLLDLTFDVYGPVTLDNDLSFYCKKTNGSDLNAWQMAVEACRKLDGEIDFTEYDRDQNGEIDNVYVFYAGEGGATGGNYEDCVWQHAGDVEYISGKQFVFDGVKLNHYACSNEYRIVRGDYEVTRMFEGIGTVCHEFSHVLGLPDLYDVLGHGCESPGEWTLMDTGCHLDNSRTPSSISAYERTMLGWIDLRPIGGKYETVSLRDLSCNEACMIPTPYENEYFVLENRQNTGWDRFAPGHGLLIWHVNYMEDYWKHNQVNTMPGMPGVVTIHADGILSHDTRDGDTFPGASSVTSISDQGYPNLRSYSGEPSNVPLTGITEAGGIVTFDVCKEMSTLPLVTGLRFSEVTPRGFRIDWDELQLHETAYWLNLYTMDGDKRNYVKGFHNIEVSENHVTVGRIEPDTEYFATVAAISGNSTGSACDPVSTVTGPLTFAYEIPVIENISEITTNSATVDWRPVTGACDYEVSLFTKANGDPDISSADFTGGLETLPRGWSTNCSFTIAIKGYYGESSPALSMADDFARIQSPVFSGRLRSISFWYRERSASGKSFLAVEALADGVWTSVDSIMLPAKMAEGEIYSVGENSPRFPANASAFRLVYHRVDKGTLAIDDIVAGYNDNPVSTPVDGWNASRMSSASTTARVSGLRPATRYFVSVKAIDTEGTRTLASDECVFVTADGSGIGITDNDSGITIGYDGTLTISDNSIPEIYDLLGRHIAGSRLPSRGIYIVKVSGKVYKLSY